MYKVGTIDLKN